MSEPASPGSVSHNTHSLSRCVRELTAVQSEGRGAVQGQAPRSTDCLWPQHCLARPDLALLCEQILGLLLAPGRVPSGPAASRSPRA